MKERKDPFKEIISAWGENFADDLDKMGLSEWIGMTKKLKGIPTLTGKIQKIKTK
jgi:hypothetical protein